MADPIPREWRDVVCKILTDRAPNTIQVTRQAAADWLSLFPRLFVVDLYDAITRYLRQDEALGSRVDTMDEPGTTYWFIMMVEERPVYTKLCLRAGGKIILLYSAHRPRK